MTAQGVDERAGSMVWASAKLGMQDGQPGRKEWRGRRTSTSSKAVAFVSSSSAAQLLPPVSVVTVSKALACCTSPLTTVVTRGAPLRAVVMKSRKDLPEACHSAETILQASRVRAPFPPGSSFSGICIWSGSLLVSSVQRVSHFRGLFLPLPGALPLALKGDF